MNRGLLRFVLCGIKLLYRRICKVYSSLMNGNKNVVYIFMKNRVLLLKNYNHHIRDYQLRRNEKNALLK